MSELCWTSWILYSTTLMSSLWRRSTVLLAYQISSTRYPASVQFINHDSQCCGVKYVRAAAQSHSLKTTVVVFSLFRVIVQTSPLRQTPSLVLVRDLTPLWVWTPRACMGRATRAPLPWECRVDMAVVPTLVLDLVPCRGSLDQGLTP